MTSTELKNDKQIFINNVNKFIDEYNEVLAKVKAINNTFRGSVDTILKNEMVAKNEEIATNISNMISKINSEKASAIIKIDEEIKRLEEYERKLLEEKDNIEE